MMTREEFIKSFQFTSTNWKRDFERFKQALKAFDAALKQMSK